MLSRKNRQKPGQVRHNEKSLYPVLYVTEHLKDYKEALISKEVESLWELTMVGNSFSHVLKKADQGDFPCQPLGGAGRTSPAGGYVR